MHVIVTGASGFVGPKIIELLASSGHSGVAISRKKISDLPSGWTWTARRDALHLGDDHLGQADWLIHLEVKQHVDSPTPADREEFQRTNVDGLRDWLELSTNHGISRIVYFSTIKAVGECMTLQDETASSLPSSPYGASKREAERVVSQWAQEQNDRSALILRPAVIYGPGNIANVYSMVRAIDRGLFFLVGTNENVKSLVSIANVAAAVLHLMRGARAGVDIFNLVDEKSYSVSQIASTVTRLLGRQQKVRAIPMWAAICAAELGHCVKRVTGKNLPLTRSRLKALTETTHFSANKLMASGFVHPQTTEEGLREMVEWYKRNRA